MKKIIYDVIEAKFLAYSEGLSTHPRFAGLRKLRTENEFEECLEQIQ